MMDKRALYIGISIAASWAWGVSLLVGLSILDDRGSIPFIVWAAANSITIPIFGFVVLRMKLLIKAIENPLLKTFMIFVQLFSLWLQMQAVFTASQIAGITEQTSFMITIATGVVFVLLVAKDGLKVSMFTDQIQWGITIGGVALLIIIGMINGESSNISLGYTTENMSWAYYTAFTLLFVPFVDLQGWQRAKLAINEGKRKAFAWAGIAFGMYMIMILVLSQFARSDMMALIIMVVAFAVATSTMDSNAVALQEISKKNGFKNVGLWLTILAVVSWPLIRGFGIVDLWVFISSARMFVAIILLTSVGFITWKRR